MASTSSEIHGSDTKYEKAPLDEEQDGPPATDDTPLSPNGTKKEPKAWWLSTVLLVLFSACWLLPAFTLLVLNVTNYTIGASAWCPSGKCWITANDNSSAVPLGKIAHFDHESHNLLGALQLVSKALEVWFGAICISLMYLITMRLASGPLGLPLRLITLPYEFTDVCSIFDLSIWRTLPETPHTHARRAVKFPFRAWALAVAAVALCIVCNLMGPATAVLVLPALVWQKTAEVESGYFDQFNTRDPPLTSGSWTYRDSHCHELQFAAQNYSCTGSTWGASLDTWFAAWILSWTESTDGQQLARTAQQDNVFFYINAMNWLAAATSSAEVVWVPSRQVVSSLSKDRTIVANMSLAHDVVPTIFPEGDMSLYAVYNKSLGLEIWRTGPILGTIPSTNTQADWWTTTIDNRTVETQKAVTCFANYHTRYIVNGTSKFTKCIQVGEGWGGCSHGRFSAETPYGVNGTRERPEISVWVASSRRAVFLPNGQFPSNLDSSFDPTCIGGRNDGLVSEGLRCDWDYFFNATFNEFSASNMTDFVTTVAMTQQITPNQSSGMVVDFVTFYNFTNHTFDPGMITNPMRVVQTPSLPASGTAVPLHPAWLFAAWSVDWSTGGNLDMYRTATLALLSALDYHRSNTRDLPSNPNATISASLYVPIMQALSLVDYSWIEAPANPNLIDEGRMQRHARMNVWAYGLNSRTAYLGITIVIAGIVLVLVQIALSLADRRRSKSIDQVIVAALAHVPGDEFQGCNDDEVRAESVRFRLTDKMHCPGEIKFKTVH